MNERYTFLSMKEGKEFGDDQAPPSMHSDGSPYERTLSVEIQIQIVRPFPAKAGDLLNAILLGHDSIVRPHTWVVGLCTWVQTSQGTWISKFSIRDLS